MTADSIIVIFAFITAIFALATSTVTYQWISKRDAEIEKRLKLVEKNSTITFPTRRLSVFGCPVYEYVGVADIVRRMMEVLKLETEWVAAQMARDGFFRVTKKKAQRRSR